MRTSIDRVGTVHEFVSGVFGDDLHAKRVLSLSYGALGVATSASLAVAMIGHGLAQARGVAVDGGEDPRLFGGGNIFGEQEGLSR